MKLYFDDLVELN